MALAALTLYCDTGQNITICKDVLLHLHCEEWGLLKKNKKKTVLTHDFLKIYYILDMRSCILLSHK